MVGSTSYIHITVNVGLQEIKDKVAEYTQAIISYKVLGNQTFKSLAPSWNPVYVPSEPAVRFENQQLEYVNLVEMFVSDAGRLKSRIVNLWGSLPTPSRGVRAERGKQGLLSTLFRAGKKVLGGAAGGLGTNIIKVVSKGILRSLGSSSILWSLGQGIQGTFIGILSQMQIRKRNLGRPRKDSWSSDRKSG